MRGIRFITSAAVVASCTFGLATVSTAALGQPAKAEAKAGGKDSHTFGPVTVGSGEVSKRLPPPMATVDLYTKAGEVVKDPPPVTGPVVLFLKPSVGQTVSDGPLNNEDGKGNKASASGKMTGSVTEEGERAVTVTKVKEGSVSAEAAPKDGFAKATASVRDPVVFDKTTEGSAFIQVGLSLAAGLSFEAQGTGFSSYRDDAATDLPGVGSLWTLAIDLSGETEGFSVAFSSHPSLGLSDSFITSRVRDAFAQVGTTYSLSADLDVFTASLLIPAAISQVAFTDGSEWNAQASTIPEPSTVLLLAAGLAAVGARANARRSPRGAARPLPHGRARRATAQPR